MNKTKKRMEYEKKYNEMRGRDMRRISQYISLDDHAILCEMGAVYGSKKTAILQGIRLLKENFDKGIYIKVDI